ncbi:hypothetical protein DFP72DRAFT_895318 [Ephemerocybe angulata]|uniref:Uncharacterized protein n=1 Tax=Ephemerocybe angulata TaxID=980116 RepID=A0A8H6I1T5_9AGAR|nr:hypothetical protein DFP72DRAFT_895318 [Tulosesus angulatus]
MGDSSCRVMVVASTLAKAALLVQDITSLKRRHSGEEETGSSSNRPILPDNANEPVYYPWSISNRYYTANIHFALHTISQVYGAVFDGVPAVIVAWAKGEPFEEYLETVQKALEEHDPEVLLGVRLSSEDNRGDHDSEEETEEDNSAVDATLMTFGFEYIDASVTDISGPSESQSDETVADEGIPGLPRVIDALSTIMWPSMSSDADTFKDGDPLRQDTLEAIVNRDPLAIMQALEELDSEFSFQSDEDVANYLEGEEAVLYKAALDQYSSHDISLDTNASSISTSDSSYADWTQNTSTIRRGPPLEFGSLEDILNRFSQRTASPTELRLDGDGDEAFGMFKDGSKAKASLGFEDDFTAYVSPPLEDGVSVLDDDFSHLHVDTSSTGSSTPDYKPLQSSDQSHFLHTGSLYHSLGSTSDLGNISDNS